MSSLVSVAVSHVVDSVSIFSVLDIGGIGGGVCVCHVCVCSGMCAVGIENNTKFERRDRKRGVAGGLLKIWWVGTAPTTTYITAS